MIRRRPLAALALCAAVVLAGCTQQAPTARTRSSTGAGSTTAPAKGSLTNSQMASIVTATMATNNRANRSIDLSLLKTYEAGSALAIDAASYAESAKTTSSACSYPPFGISVLETLALGGTSYPRRFLALGTSRPLTPPKGCTAPSTSCPDADSLFEYEQPAAQAPWKIVLEPSAPTGRIVDLAADGSAAAPLPEQAAAEAEHLPGTVAKALGSFETTGHLGRLSAGEFQSSCFVLPNPRAAFEQYVKSGVTEQQVYTPATDLVTAPLSGGGALSLFTLNFVTTLVPTAADGSIEWVSVPSAEPVTALLPTGQYSRIVQHGAMELAVTTSSSGRFTIIGAYSGVTSITGTKGSSGQGSGGGVLV